ncbi:MAG: hypothetical protein MUF13_06805, partial [Akkermansiaceae bacterium]|nr:hypothetical protein [Akkermansiaceae bacterium]
MTEADLLRVMRLHTEKLFPKSCHNCGNLFASPRDFFENTSSIGSVISYDADGNDWKPADPLGTLGFFNCPCGNTLALGTEGMELQDLWSAMAWVKNHCETHQTPLENLLNNLREKLYDS